MNLSTWIPERGPVRAFALVNLLNTVGSGLYLAGGALFFTRGLALPPQTVAWGLGAGFAVGLVVSLAIGRLADRIEPYVVYTTLLVVQALAMSAYPFVSSVVGFVAVALVSGTADRGIAATVGAVIHRLSGEHSRTLVRAQLRTTTNVGIALGSLLAGIALAADTRLGYSLLIWGNAASSDASGASGVRLRPSPGRAARTAAPAPAPPPSEARGATRATSSSPWPAA